MTIKIEGLTPSQTLRHIQNFICEDTAPHDGFMGEDVCSRCQNQKVCSDMDDAADCLRNKRYLSEDKVAEIIRQLLTCVKFNDISVEVIDNGKV